MTVWRLRPRDSHDGIKTMAERFSWRYQDQGREILMTASRPWPRDSHDGIKTKAERFSWRYQDNGREILMTVSRPRPRESHDGITSKAPCTVTPCCSVDGKQGFEETCFFHIRINDSRSLKKNAFHSFDMLLPTRKAIRCVSHSRRMNWLVERSKVYKHVVCCTECGVTRARHISSDMRMEIANVTQEVR